MLDGSLWLCEEKREEENVGQFEFDVSSGARNEGKDRNETHLCRPQLIETQIKASAEIPETSHIN